MTSLDSIPRFYQKKFDLLCATVSNLGVLGKIDRILLAMTPDERNRPESMDEIARCRIANESGAEIDEIESLLCHFFRIRDQVRVFESLSPWQRFLSLVRRR